MGTTLLITRLQWNSRTYIATALYQDKKILELHLEPDGQQSILGNIYVGRVKNIVKNLNAAFIEIAPGIPCYYPLEELKQPLYVKKINSPRLVQGDELVVQIAQESSKSKPPKVTTNLNLTGNYLVLTSENTTLGISRKLDEKKRQELKQDLTFEENSDYGIIVRTNAAFASRQEILKEYQKLKEEFIHLKKTAPCRTTFSCLKESTPEYLHVLQGLNRSLLEKVITDDPELFEKTALYLKHMQPEEKEKLTFYEDNLLSLNKLYHLDIRLKEALQEKVWLKSGGYLIIQPTEALTVVDVNSGKSISGKQAQEHYLKINLEAAEELAHQLRLRNLSGIIIIDFIDMKSTQSQELLMQTLRSAVRSDSVPVQVVDRTKLNLVEITRKKVKKSLAEQVKSH
ncbi:rne/Rng family ribonuclease [Eubacterium sp. 14-2]|uniref:ribonuclease E/G n=1 Tax=Eubacterium sp. 14-2 TaxID=1235790 RepID=UPI0003351279|nr:ribonuclease E/G [Eubacterium sp. 14-2]EOT27769.1 rne/Rng family ribonuclease [Eubacterium sp. 14-2]